MTRQEWEERHQAAIEKARLCGELQLKPNPTKQDLEEIDRLYGEIKEACEALQFDLDMRTASFATIH